jgi:hypothetical protein
MVKMLNVIFWVVTLCSLVSGYRRFELRFLTACKTTTRHNVFDYNNIKAVIQKTAI